MFMEYDSLRRCLGVKISPKPLSRACPASAPPLSQARATACVKLGNMSTIITGVLPVQSPETEGPQARGKPNDGRLRETRVSKAVVHGPDNSNRGNWMSDSGLCETACQ